MHRTWICAGVGFVFIAVGVACDDSSGPGGGIGSIDGGALDAAGPGTPPSGQVDAGNSGDSGSTVPPSALTGLFIRFAHLAESQKANQLDFCFTAPGASSPSLVYAPLGAAGGLHYGEVGRFVPIGTGDIEIGLTATGSCDDEIRHETVNIAPGSTYVRMTFAATLTSTGVLNAYFSDVPALRDPAKDRLTVLDGTGPRDPGTPLAASWSGSSTVDVSVLNNTRSKTVQLPAGELGQLEFTLPGLPAVKHPLRTVAGGHAMVVVYGAGETRTCDFDAPIPTTGALSTCNERN